VHTDSIPAVLIWLFQIRTTSMLSHILCV